MAPAAGTLGCTSTSLNTSTTPSPAKCQVTVDGPAEMANASGGMSTAKVGAQPECAWTATSDANWIVEPTPSSGQGAGQVQFRVMMNPDPVTRQGNLAVNGVTLRVTQAAAACRFEIPSPGGSISPDGAVVTLALTTADACAWTATTDVPWLTLKAPASGNGSAPITITVAANTGNARTGTFTAGGVSVIVSQSAHSVTCTYTVEPSSQSIGSAGGAGIPVGVSTSPGCQWTTTSEASWLTVTSGVSGSGGGAVGFTAAANTGPDRMGSLRIAGKTFTVTQAGLTPAPQPNCSYAINSSTHNAAAAGGAGGPVQVTAAAGCAWTATSAVSWVTITSGATGSGAGSVAFTIAANTGAGRSGTLAIAGQVFTVTQAAVGGAACTYQVAPTSQSTVAGGGTGTPIVVTTTSGCAWTATSAESWLTITSGANGSGGGSVAFTVAANPGAARNGSLTIAGKTVTVTQAAAEPCTYQVAPTAQSMIPAGGTGAPVVVTTTSGCAWTATSGTSWITITSGGSGSGTGSVAFTVAENLGTSRSGTLTIAGETFTVNQGSGCVYQIAPTSQSMAASGGTGTPIALTTVPGCWWMAESGVSWITVTSAAESFGTGSVSFTVTANTGPARSGTITIASQPATVTQAAAPPPCGYQIAPTAQSMAASGGAGTPIAVTTASGCAWTATSGVPWLTITSGGAGNGSGTVAFAVAANSGNARSGTLTVAGQPFTVNQAAAASCGYQIAPTSQSIGAAGGAGTSITVTTTAGCAWTATSGVPWLTVTSGPGGNGPGMVAFTIAANTGTARSGTLTVAGQTFTVNQGSGCIYGIAPTAQSIGAAGGAGTSIAVTTTAGCAWTATSGVPWLTVTSGPGGNGPGTVAFTIAANTGTARSGTLTVAGQTFTVNQGSGCIYGIAPTAQSIGAAGGAGTSIAVTTAAGCAWTATSGAPWLTVTSGPGGNGPGTVAFTIAANAGTARNGTLTVAGQTFTVTQQGR